MPVQVGRQLHQFGLVLNGEEDEVGDFAGFGDQEPSGFYPRVDSLNGLLMKGNVAADDNVDVLNLLVWLLGLHDLFPFVENTSRPPPQQAGGLTNTYSCLLYGGKGRRVKGFNSLNRPVQLFDFLFVLGNLQLGVPLAEFTHARRLFVQTN